MKLNTVSGGKLIGKQNGLVFAYTAMGQLARAMATPTNRRTPGQTASRSTHKTNAGPWNSLSTAAKAAWSAWGHANPIANSIGQLKTISGYNTFTRENRARASAGLPIVTVAPVANGYPTFTLPELIGFSMTSDVHVEITPGDDWANETGAYMIIYIGHAVSGAKTRSSERFQFVGVIAGNNAGIVSGWDFTSPIAVAALSAGQFTRVQVTRADGRLSL